MPNAPDVKIPIRRGLLLLKAFPQVVPGTTFQQSLIGQAIDELSHLENLPDRIPILAAAGLILLAALGLGELVILALGLRAWARPLERTALAFGLGTAGLGVLTLLVGRAGLLNPWLFRVGLGLIALAGLGVSRPWKLGRLIMAVFRSHRMRPRSPPQTPPSQGGERTSRADPLFPPLRRGGRGGPLAKALARRKA